jgi:hypothetical protein
MTAFRTQYEREVAARLDASGVVGLVTEGDLVKLPSLLQTYLRRVGVVGRPQMRNFRVRFSGDLRPSHDSGWMPIRADQHTFLGPDPARLFLVKASRFGLPVESYHRFMGPTATMQVRVASLLQVVEARGPEMDQGETVTFFNDLCLLAPAALLEVDALWEEGAEGTLKGTFHHQGHRVTAVLRFDEQGDLADFRSEDRFQSANGKTYRCHPWSTPIRAYGDFGGFHLMAEGDALWQEPAGPFPYARFRVEEIAYNVGPRPEEGAP